MFWFVWLIDLFSCSWYSTSWRKWFRNRLFWSETLLEALLALSLPQVLVLSPSWHCFCILWYALKAQQNIVNETILFIFLVAKITSYLLVTLLLLLTWTSRICNCDTRACLSLKLEISWVLWFFIVFYLSYHMGFNMVRDCDASMVCFFITRNQ